MTAKPSAAKQIDPQDALPESSWGYRRFLTYGVTIVALAYIAYIIWKTPEGQYLAGIAYGLIGLIAWMATLYLIAPTGEHVARILSLSSISKAVLRRGGTDYGSADEGSPYDNVDAELDRWNNR